MAKMSLLPISLAVSSVMAAVGKPPSSAVSAKPLRRFSEDDLDCEMAIMAAAPVMELPRWACVNVGAVRRVTDRLLPVVIPGRASRAPGIHTHRRLLFEAIVDECAH